uniref:Sushi domain containing 5 n=1 Tax=Hucho hucho TaxID=62062 RepID=A0A4W5PAE1_9TELE
MLPWHLLCSCCKGVLSPGRVFLLDQRNTSDSGGLAEAEHACASHDARLASAEELRHTVVECSFAVCTRGWLDGGSYKHHGTTQPSYSSGRRRVLSPRDERTLVRKVQINPRTTAKNLVKMLEETGVPCGDPPAFPNTHLQSHTGFEMGDELLYSCLPGHVLPSGHSAFSLLCDSCGEWYGLVQLCVKGKCEEEVGEGLVTGREEEDLEDSTDHPVDEEKQEEEQEEEMGMSEATEAPISLLSQKHLFWFPSEAFQEAGHVEPTHPPVTQDTPPEGDNRVRASGSESEESKEDNSQPEETKDHDSHEGQFQQPIDHNDHDDHEGDVDHEHIDHEYDHDDQTDPDHDESSEQVFDGEDHHGPAPTTWTDDVIDKEERAAEHNLTQHSGEREGEEGEREGETGEAGCTGGEEDCPPPPPPSSVRGPTVAAIVIVVCTVALAAAVGAWCYRRKQQKSSMYEMNGKGQSHSRHGQQIEMQQKV